MRQNILKIYLTALVTFLVFELIWIGLLAQSFYIDQIGFLLSENPNWLAAGLFYLLFIAGLLYFSILPALNNKATKKGVIQAAFYGLMTYGTYALSNLSLIENWPVSVTVLDMIWGTIVSIMVYFVTVNVNKRPV